MLTRSKTRQLMKELEFIFDFNDASECWKENKKSIGNGCYHYLCGYSLENGDFCKKTPLKNKEFCCIHNKKKTFLQKNNIGIK